MKKFIFIFYLAAISCLGSVLVLSYRRSRVLSAPNIDWGYISGLPNPNSGTQQTASLVLDINKDGIDDFVVAERTKTPSVVWYKYKGNKQWGKYVVDNSPLKIEAGGDFYDIDGDGDLDISFAGDAQSNQIWWWENPYPNYNSPWTRRYIKNSGAKKHHDQIFGDFDGDGKTELVFWNQGASGLYIVNIPSNPKNTQPWPGITKIFSASSSYEGLAKVDIDGDGKIDIIGAGRWFKHQGGNNYSVETIDSGFYFSRSAAGQLKSGGRPEVVIGPGDSDGILRWYQWNGNSWTAHTLMSNVKRGHSLRVADINNDGHLDIFMGEMGNPGAGANARTVIFWGDGAGNFDTEVIDTGKAHHESRLGDLDGDGDIDIFGKPYNYGAPGLHVWLQEGSGNPTPTPTPGSFPLDQWQRHLVDGSLGDNAVFVLAGDLDGDNKKDLIAGQYWWKNPGGLSGSWARKTIGSPLNNASIVADFDNDGHLDIFGTQGTGSSSNHNLAWAHNDGSGDFAIKTNINTGGSGDFLQGAVLADFGSGKQIALSWHNGGGGVQAVTIPTNPSSGNWSFTTLSTTTLGEDLSAGDIDRDGDLDLLLGTKWLRNEGGTWRAFTLGSVSSGEPDRNDLADINGDGRLDAVVGLENGTEVYWFEAPDDPTGDWIRHTIGTAAGEGFSMDAADFDQDGDPDVVLGEHRGSSNNRVIIFENTGQDSSWPQHVIDTDSKNTIDHHDGTQAVDLDNDGGLDLISVGWYNKKVWVYENLAIANGTTPTPTPTPIPPPNPYSLDGDDDVDSDDVLILLGNWSNGSQGDFNSDGKINGIDFGHVIKNWSE